MISGPARLALAAALRGTSAISESASSSLIQVCALATASKMTEWHWMKERGIEVNPCNSKLHPAVIAGAFDIQEDSQELPVQEAYTPSSSCFGCGPNSETGLRLRSYRAEKGLISKITVPNQFQAFPGIINGGVVSTLFDCHGNWTAAIALMDQKRLPRPPLTLSAQLLVQYLEPTPPGQELILTSQISVIDECEQPSGRKERVTVDMLLTQVQPDGTVKELAKAVGQFKKMGALRAI